MTMIVTFLIGAGVLILASGLDGSSLSDTFNKIITNQPIDWTGSGKPTPGSSSTDTTTQPATTSPGKGNKSCAAGYSYNAATGLCEKSKGPGPS